MVSELRRLSGALLAAALIAAALAVVTVPSIGATTAPTVSTPGVNVSEIFNVGDLVGDGNGATPSPLQDNRDWIAANVDYSSATTVSTSLAVPDVSIPAITVGSYIDFWVEVPEGETRNIQWGWVGEGYAQIETQPLCAGTGLELRDNVHTVVNVTEPISYVLDAGVHRVRVTQVDSDGTSNRWTYSGDAIEPFANELSCQPPDPCLVANAAPLTALSGTLPDGTTYTVTGVGGVFDGDFEINDSGTAAVTFSAPVDLILSGETEHLPTTGVWHSFDAISPPTQAITNGGDWRYTPGERTANVILNGQTVTAHPTETADDFLGLDEVLLAGDDYGTFITENVTSMTLRGNATFEVVRFTTTPGSCNTSGVTESPSLALDKAAEFNETNGTGGAQVGETITYSFTVTNTGNATVTNITIDDPLLTVPGTIATLAPGAVDDTTFEVVYTLDQDDIDAGEVVNQATASGATPLGAPVEAVSNNPATTDAADSTNLALTVVCGAAPEVANAINVAGSADIHSGTGQFGIDVVAHSGTQYNGFHTRIGTGDPFEVISIPVDEVLQGDPFFASFAVHTAHDGLRVWDRPSTLNMWGGTSVGDTAELIGSVLLSDSDAGWQELAFEHIIVGSSITHVTISNDSRALGEEAYVAFDSFQQGCIPIDASLSLDKVGVFNDTNGDGDAQAGETITYSFTVRNTGNVTLSDITIDDPLVAVPGTIGTLAPGAVDTDTFEAIYTIDQDDIDAGVVENQAIASGSEPSGGNVTDQSHDPNSTGSGSEENGNTPTQTNFSGNGQFEFDKVAMFNDENGDGFAQVGETVTYSFTIANTGNITITNISLDDPLVAVDGDPIALAPGETDTDTFSATYTLTQSDLDAGGVDNQATVAGTGSDGALVSGISNDPSTAGELDVTVLSFTAGFGDTPAALAFTGRTSTATAAIATLLLVLGVTLVYASRRREHIALHDVA